MSIKVLEWLSQSPDLELKVHFAQFSDLEKISGEEWVQSPAAVCEPGEEQQELFDLSKCEQDFCTNINIV